MWKLSRCSSNTDCKQNKERQTSCGIWVHNVQMFRFLPAFLFHFFHFSFISVWLFISRLFDQIHFSYPFFPNGLLLFQLLFSQSVTHILFWSLTIRFTLHKVVQVCTYVNDRMVNRFLSNRVNRLQNVATPIAMPPCSYGNRAIAFTRISRAKAVYSLLCFLFSSYTTLAIFSYSIHLLSPLLPNKRLIGYKIIIANELELNRNSWG